MRVITNDPNEWKPTGHRLWQHVEDDLAFSYDEGKTYFVLNGKTGFRRRILGYYVSENPNEKRGTMLDIQRFTHIPLYVDAIRVTEDNMTDVSVWCEGKIMAETDKLGRKVYYISVVTIRPINIRQTQAFIGDWVLRTAMGIKVYPHKAFSRSFIPAPEKSDGQVVERLENLFQEANPK